MRLAAPGGSHAAIIEGGRKSTQISDALCPQYLDNRHHVHCKRIRLLGQRLATKGQRRGCVGAIAELRAVRLARGKRRPGPLRDQPPLLLGQCRVDVEHEGVSIATEFGDDEWHTLRHQAGHKGHVAGKPVELGHNDRTFPLPPRGQRCGQLKPSVEGIGALARLDLKEFADQFEPLGRGKTGYRLALGIDALLAPVQN